MAQEDVRLSGTFLDSAGNALASKTVTLFSEGTITPALATDTTDSSGEWDFTRTTPGRYDVQLVNNTQTYRILSRDKFQVSELQSRNATSLTQPAGIFTNTYTNGGAAAAGLTAIHSFRPATESSGVESAVAGVNGSSVYNDFQLTNDNATPQDFIAGRMAFEAVDVTDGSEASQLNLWAMTGGTLVEELHLDGAALWPETDAGLDLGTSALGFNDLHLGSGGVINLDGGDVTLTHSSNTLTVAGGTFATAALTTSTIVASGIIKTDDSTPATTIDDGSLQTDGGLSVTLDAVIGDDLILISDSAVLSLGIGADVTLTHDGTTGGTLAGNPIEIDSGGNITLDAHTGIFIFQDANTEILRITESGSGDVTVKLETNAKDLIFTDNNDDAGLTVKDGAVGIVVPGEVMTTKISYTDGDDAITIADGGGTTFAQNATFSSDLTVTGTTTLNGTLVLGDAAADTLTVNATIQGATPLVFEGDTGGEFETSFAIADPSADRTITFPDLTGTVALTGVAQTWSTTGTVATGALTVTGDTIVGNGYGMVVGHSSQVAVGGQTPELQILGTGYGDSRWSVGLWKNDSIGGRGYFTKSRNATIGSSTRVQDNDEIGMLVFTADDGVDFVSEAARIGVFVDGTPDENDMPGRIVMSTTADGAASPTEAMRITSTQGVHVYEWLALQNGKKLYFDTGSDTYIYEESADDLHIVSGNVAWVQIDNNVGMAVGNGSGMAPQANMGIFVDVDKTGAGSGWGFGTYWGGVLTGASGDTSELGYFTLQGQVETQSESEVVAVGAQLILREPRLVENGSGTFGIGATLYIRDAPDEADTNAAIYVAGGDVILANGKIDAADFGTTGQADQAAMEAQTNENTYVAPDFVNYSPGVAKGWIKFDGSSGSIGTGDASHNVSSVTDSDTGDYIVNWDTNFSSAHYSVTLGGANGKHINEGYSAVPAAGTTQIATSGVDWTSADSSRIYVTAHGDQ